MRLTSLLLFLLACRVGASPPERTPDVALVAPWAAGGLPIGEGSVVSCTPDRIAVAYTTAAPTDRWIAHFESQGNTIVDDERGETARRVRLAGTPALQLAVSADADGQTLSVARLAAPIPAESP